MSDTRFDQTRVQGSEEKENGNSYVPDIENSNYLPEQMQQIRLGMDEGLNVSLYASTEFNRFQMEQIRMGLKDEVEASLYADPSYHYETMRQIRLSCYSFVDLMPYLNRGFVNDELQEIRLALEKELPIDRWITDDMCAQQICEIRTGLLEGLDVDIYASDGYNWIQMREIRLGLKKELNVFYYANAFFNYRQMKEIRLGLEEGLDVSSYAKLIYSTTDMREKRQKLLAEKNPEKPVAEVNMRSLRVAGKQKIHISVEENANKVYAMIPKNTGIAVTEEDVYAELESRHIQFGIKKEEISALVQGEKMRRKVLIAEGVLPQDGKDGWHEFLVRTFLPRIPEPLPDGGVDYANIEAFEMVDEGEKIAIYHPAEEGTDGRNVFGEVLRAQKGCEKPKLRGEGFFIDPDGVTYRSRRNGKFELVNGQIKISNMIVVNEDVTAVSGKIEVDGSVYVVGSIYSGGYIKATEDIIVEYNMEAGQLIAGRNIMIKRGSCSKHNCEIVAGGEVSGSFFEAADITAEGDVKANYIMNSDIHTLGRVIVSGAKGRVFGGRICAVKGVDTYTLGNDSDIKTVLDVGKNDLYLKKRKEFETERNRITDEIQLLQEKSQILFTKAGDMVEEYLEKIALAIASEEKQLEQLENEINRFERALGRAPVCVRGKAYAGNVICINKVEYQLPQEVQRVILKEQDRRVVMVRL